MVFLVCEIVWFDHNSLHIAAQPLQATRPISNRMNLGCRLLWFRRQRDVENFLLFKIAKDGDALGICSVEQGLVSEGEFVLATVQG